MRALLRSVVFGLAGMAFAGSVPAGSFQVSPVRIELAAARSTTVLRVTNTGEEAVTVQAEVRSWSCGHLHILSRSRWCHSPFSIGGDCLCYIELNMVRGAVNHPRVWEWVGYHEIMGE